MNAAVTEPHTVVSGAACVVLARVLAPLVAGQRLDGELRAALIAIGTAAEAQRAAEAARQRQDVTLVAGWLPVKEAAIRRGCSPQAIRKRIARGTLAAERRGRAWLVESV